ncbi:pyridoxal-phosphate dependent enzyme, partial [Nonomuraea turkmeniaca]
MFVQAGVGGLAAAAAGYVRDRWGEKPRIVVVEPDGAPCLIESARAGRPLRVPGSHT